ncbi:MAG: hypothetical protein FWF81_13555 [Defluviitaleaceae bacterium]|nr:hypothetical protein [Defluviitaleaceae bacterium]
MSDELITLIETNAQKIARLGFDIRKESLSELADVQTYMKDMMSLVSELGNASANKQLIENRANLTRIILEILSAYELMDTVTIADGLEYKLLHELEDILNKLS